MDRIYKGIESLKKGSNFFPSFDLICKFIKFKHIPNSLITLAINFIDNCFAFASNTFKVVQFIIKF